VRKITIFAVCAVAFAACGPQKEREPDDDYSQATPVKAGKIVGALSKADDSDVYKVEPSQELILSALVGGIREADFVLSIHDRDRVPLKRADETTVGGDEELVDLVVRPPGPYYVVLRNKNPSFANSSQEYEMELKLDKAVGREREPNDTPQQAAPLDLPGVTRGHHWPSQNLLSGDTDYIEQDWYRVELSTGLFLMNVDLSETPKVDPVIEIYDTNGYKLKEVDSGGVGEGESLKNFGVRGPALNYLRLRAKNRVGNPDVPYEMLTELIPYQGRSEFEPNDQRQDATPFEGESITGTIAPEGDGDWFKVTVQDPSRQILRASVTGIEGLDLTLSLLDSFGNPLVAVDNMAKGQPEVLTGYGVSQGEYYLVVGEKSERKADARQPYTLAKNLVPFQPGLEWESNESTAAAQAIKVAESVDGYLAPKGDVDYYQFNVYQKGVVAFELAGVLNVQLAVDLFDQEFKPLQQWTSAKAGESMAFEKELDAGTYFARISTKDPAHNNVRDKYSFRLKVR
jgi:hypothetical protein